MTTTFAPIASMIGQPVGEGVTVNTTIQSEGKTIGVVNGTWQWLPELTKAEFYTLLEPFLKLLEKEQNERYAESFPDGHRRALEAGRRGYEHIGFDEGDRFVKVWKESGGKSVHSFVEKKTGIIFGAKGWKAFNPNNEFGTLHTINEWSWGEYYGKSKKGLKTLTPKHFRRK